MNLNTDDLLLMFLYISYQGLETHFMKCRGMKNRREVSQHLTTALSYSYNCDLLSLLNIFRPHASAIT